MKFLKLLHNLPELGVDADLEAFAKLVVAEGALMLLLAHPVPGDAGLAEVVSTRSGNRFGIDIQADGACELIRR